VTLEAPVNITPLWANLHPRSQKRRRMFFNDSPVRPLYFARIQRISRPQAWWSTALNVVLDTPYRK
jgi:hypothetical protein